MYFLEIFEIGVKIEEEKRVLRGFWRRLIRCGFFVFEKYVEVDFL